MSQLPKLAQFVIYVKLCRDHPSYCIVLRERLLVIKHLFLYKFSLKSIIDECLLIIHYLGY